MPIICANPYCFVGGHIQTNIDEGNNSRSTGLASYMTNMCRNLNSGNAAKAKRMIQKKQSCKYVHGNNISLNKIKRWERLSYMLRMNNVKKANEKMRIVI